MSKYKYFIYIQKRFVKTLTPLELLTGLHIPIILFYMGEYT